MSTSPGSTVHSLASRRSMPPTASHEKLEQPRVSTRRLLPLVSMTGTRHGSRSFRTCELKCANQCDHPEPNTSGNEHIQSVMRTALSRRRVLKTGAAGLGAAGVAALSHGVVPPNREDALVIPEGYEQSVIIRWGDPVVAGAPRFDVDNQTPEAQAKQFGYNNDYTMILPLHDERRALLVCNQEYTDEYIMFPTGRYDDDTIKKIAMAAHGMTVVGIERVRDTGQWRRDRVHLKYNRRI